MFGFLWKKRNGNYSVAEAQKALRWLRGRAYLDLLKPFGIEHNEVGFPTYSLVPLCSKALVLSCPKRSQSHLFKVTSLPTLQNTGKPAWECDPSSSEMKKANFTGMRTPWEEPLGVQLSPVQYSAL